jgi:membrane protein YdbS with pleckstrin-like domain
MKCPGCGIEVVDKSVYCHKCGERLDSPTGEGALSEQRDPADGAVDQTPNCDPAERIREVTGSGRGGGDPREQELWQGGYCLKAMAGTWVLSLLASIAVLIVGFWFANRILWWCVLAAIVLLWLYQIVILLRRRLGVHYRLTTQRFFHESGILIHTTDLIEVIDMDDVTYRQTLIDRMTGVGTIRIVSSDRSHPNLSIDGIEKVHEVAAMLQDARHAERIRRGLHIEQI